MTPNIRYLQRLEWQRVRRFFVVGVSSTVLDFLLLAILKKAGLPTLTANTLAYGLATIYNFGCHRHWTYSDGRSRSLGAQFAIFVVVNLIALLLNDAMVLLFESLLGALLHDLTWSYLPAKVVATVVVAGWSWVANRTWVF